MPLMYSFLLAASVDIIHRRGSRGTLIITFMINTRSLDSTFLLVDFHAIFTNLNTIHWNLRVRQTCGTQKLPFTIQEILLESHISAVQQTYVVESS